MGKAEILDRLDEHQYNLVKQYIEYHFSEDCDEEFREEKLSIYEKYSNTISELIAKYEVYCRDLPRDIVGIIEVIFRLLSSAALADERDKIEKAYDIVLKCENYAINKLYLKLCRGYTSRIKDYMKTLRRFKHTGIKVSYDNEFLPVLDLAKKQLKRIKYNRKNGWKKLKRITKKVNGFNELDTVYIQMSNADAVSVIDELKLAFELSEKTLEDIEDSYPKIINNGYNDTKLNKLINKIPEIISTVFAIIAIVIWIRNGCV